MDFNHVSSIARIFLEGNKVIQFTKNVLLPNIFPTEEQLQKKVLGIELSNAYCPEQECSNDPMKKDFGVEDDGIIKKIPKEIKVETYEDVIVFKYGTTTMAPEMIDLAKKIGLVSYWDYGNLIICCSKKYEQLFNNIVQLIQPEKAKFTYKANFAGPDFAIVSV